jgi:hypothetical protein
MRDRVDVAIRKAGPNTDQAARSLLQKAVRRGSTAVARATFRYLIAEKDDLIWLRSRLAVITFEEAWPYGVKATFGRLESEILGHYVALCRQTKNKDAAGLGSLAYALSRGDKTVLLGDESDWHIRVVEKAMRARASFWDWIQAEAAPADERVQGLVAHALEGSKKAGWLWDKAFTFAAALLAVKGPIPEITYIDSTEPDPFPYWVSIDKHTPLGKEVVRAVANEVRIPPNTALWLSFYLESAVCNQMAESPWWEREKRWRFKKLGLLEAEATEIWARLRLLVAERLGPDADRLSLAISKYGNRGDSVEGREESSKPTQRSLFE